MSLLYGPFHLRLQETGWVSECMVERVRETDWVSECVVERVRETGWVSECMVERADLLQFNSSLYTNDQTLVASGHLTIAATCACTSDCCQVALLV